MDRDRAVKELDKKLDPAHVKPAPQGKYGEYVEGVHVIYEANRIFGHFGWEYDVVSLNLTNASTYDQGKHKVGYSAIVRVVVDGVARCDVGHGQGFGKSEGDAHDSAVKEAVTDALKRALRTFGNPFGLALYDKSKANVGVEPEIDEFAEADRIKAEVKKAKDKEALSGIWESNKPQMSHMCDDVYDSVKLAFKAAGDKMDEPTADEYLRAG